MATTWKTFAKDLDYLNNYGIHCAIIMCSGQANSPECVFQNRIDFSTDAMKTWCHSNLGDGAINDIQRHILIHSSPEIAASPAAKAELSLIRQMHKKTRASLRHICTEWLKEIIFPKFGLPIPISFPWSNLPTLLISHRKRLVGLPSAKSVKETFPFSTLRLNLDNVSHFQWLNLYEALGNGLLAKRTIKVEDWDFDEENDDQALMTDVNSVDVLTVGKVRALWPRPTAQKRKQAPRASATVRPPKKQRVMKSAPVIAPTDERDEAHLPSSPHAILPDLSQPFSTWFELPSAQTNPFISQHGNISASSSIPSSIPLNAPASMPWLHPHNTSTYTTNLWCQNATVPSSQAWREESIVPDLSGVGGTGGFDSFRF